MDTKQLLTILFFLFLSDFMVGQEWVKMQNEGMSFDEISAVMQKKFKGKSTLKSNSNYDRAYKKFARWEYIWRFQTDQNGNLVTPDQTLKVWEEKMIMDKKYSNKAITSNWSFVGQDVIPTASQVTYAGMGRINCVSVVPSNHNIIYVGSANGGLWKSTNAGTNWTSTGGNLPVLGVSDIALSSTGDTIYIASGDADGMHSLSLGVLKSIDGGNTFTTTGNVGNPTTAIGNAAYTEANAQYSIHHLWVHPTTANIVVATTTNGIYRTTTGGASWTQVESNPSSDLEAVYITSSNSYELYAGVVNTLVKSTDNGATWTSPSSPLHMTAGAQKLDVAAMDNGSQTVIYLLYDNGQTFKSTDSGSNWTELTANTSFAMDSNHKYNSQGGYNMALVVDKTNENRVILGGQQGYITIDGGTTWKVQLNGLKDRSTEGAYMHADHHMMIFHPGDVNTQFSAHDGGLHKGNFFDTLNWVDLSTDLKITQYYGMDGSPTNENILIAGAQDQDGVFYNGSVWKNIANNSDGTGGVIDHSNSAVSYIKSQTGGCAVTTDSWNTQVFDCTVQPQDQNDRADFVWPLEMDPSNSANVYAGHGNIYKTTNQAQNWANLTNDNDLTPYSSISVSPIDGNVIYAVKGNAIVRKTIDGGANWSNLTAPVTQSNGSPKITKIEASLNNKDSLYITYGNYSNANKVFVSGDGGSSWANISAGIPNFPVYSIAEQAGTGTVFAGTEFGVYYKETGSTSWAVFNTNLPAVRVNDLNIYQTGNILRAATFGRGIWKSPIGATTNPCTPTGTTNVVQTDLVANKIFHNGNIISGQVSPNNVNVNVNNVTFKGVNSVELKPEFQVTSPNVFIAEIGPCSTP